MNLKELKLGQSIVIGAKSPKLRDLQDSLENQIHEKVEKSLGRTSQGTGSWHHDKEYVKEYNKVLKENPKLKKLKDELDSHAQKLRDESYTPSTTKYPDTPSDLDWPNTKENRKRNKEKEKAYQNQKELFNKELRKKEKTHKNKSNDWWDTLSKEQQQRYIKLHPSSKRAK